jgi:MraZ protein
MGLFLGTYNPRLDDKGRLILPAKFRPQLADGLVLTRGQERCLYVFPLAEFQRMHEQAAAAPVSNKPARDYLRLMLSGAHDDAPDKQGRLSIPAPLREYAGLDRDVAVIGTGTRAEIWNAAAWDTYVNDHVDDYAATDEEVFPGAF